MSDDNFFSDFSAPAAPADSGYGGYSGERRSHGGHGRGGHGGGGQRRDYDNEVASERIDARNRTFFFDVKKSANGFFLKISEKSRGQRSTIMMDAEDVDAFIAAMQKCRESMGL